MTAEEFAKSIGARCVMPSKTLTGPKGDRKDATGYFGGADVAATWEAAREAMKPPAPNVASIKRRKA